MNWLSYENILKTSFVYDFDGTVSKFKSSCHTRQRIKRILTPRQKNGR